MGVDCFFSSLANLLATLRPGSPSSKGWISPERFFLLLPNHPSFFPSPSPHILHLTLRPRLPAQTCNDSPEFPFFFKKFFWASFPLQPDLAAFPPPLRFSHEVFPPKPPFWDLSRVSKLHSNRFFFRPVSPSRVGAPPKGGGSLGGGAICCAPPTNIS